MNLLQHLDQLIVLSFEVEPGDSDFLQTKDYGHIFRPETCARQLWILSKQQFDALPLGEKEWLLHKTSQSPLGGNTLKSACGFNFFLKGEKAYARFLEILCGLYSDKIGEDHVIRQLRDAWQIYCVKTAPENRQQLVDFINAIFEDVKKIRKNLSVHFKPRDEYQVLRQILEPPKDKIVLITDRPSALDPLLAALGRSESSHIGQIDYCFIGSKNDVKVCESVVATAYDKKRLTARCAPVTVEEVFTNFTGYPYTILCRSIEAQPDFRHNLVTIAAEAGKQSSKIAYIKGDGEHNQIDPEWQNLNSRVFAAPAQFKMVTHAYHNINKLIGGQIMAAASFCARIRAQGSKATEQEIIDVAIKEVEMMLCAAYPSHHGKAKDPHHIPRYISPDPEQIVSRFHIERLSARIR